MLGDFIVDLAGWPALLAVGGCVPLAAPPKNGPSTCALKDLREAFSAGDDGEEYSEEERRGARRGAPPRDREPQTPPQEISTAPVSG
jgi:hypothetical protein